MAQNKQSKDFQNNSKKFIEEEFDISGIKFPIKISDIKKFVNQNTKHNLCINMYKIWGMTSNL